MVGLLQRTAKSVRVPLAVSNGCGAVPHFYAVRVPDAVAAGVARRQFHVRPVNICRIEYHAGAGLRKLWFLVLQVVRFDTVADNGL